MHLFRAGKVAWNWSMSEALTSNSLGFAPGKLTQTDDNPGVGCLPVVGPGLLEVDTAGVPEKAINILRSFLLNPVNKHYLKTLKS